VSIENKLCTSIGPLRVERAAIDIKEKLAAQDIAASVVKVVAEVYRENWVVIPPRKDRETALRVLRELQAEGIDSYMITTAPRENAISLGVFRNLVSANEVKNSLDYLDYPVEIQFREKQSEEYWVKLSKSFQSAKEIEAINALTAANSKINTEESLCE